MRQNKETVSPMSNEGRNIYVIELGGGFITVLLLSCIFSFAFIKTKSIWTAVFLHFWWDLLLFMF